MLDALHDIYTAKLIAIVTTVTALALGLHIVSQERPPSGTMPLFS